MKNTKDMVTDPGGKSSSKTVNNLGQVVSATDNGGTITYTYCSNGQPKTINAPGSTIENRYDEYGRQTKMIDPDAGTTTYVYNGFGELYSQTDTNGNAYTMSYDNAGRLTQKTGPEGSFIYTYVPNGEPGAGLVQNIKSPGDSVGYLYNDYGLPTCITDTISGTPYTYKYTYDNLNNNTIIEYPNLFKVKRHYDANGQIDWVKRDDNSNPIWELKTENALGQPTQTKQGNGITTNYTYNQYNFLTQITSPVQNDSYVWNANTGNLTSRADNRYQLTESFTYDNLDRLTKIIKDGDSLNVGYLANGNISSKYDAGSYTYDPVKIHSISTITDNNCTSAIDQALQNITYTPFKKVKTIQQQNDSLIYTYGYDMERRKMQLFENGQLVKTRIYCGMYEKETLADSTVKEYCYVSGGGGVTAVLINQDMYYLRRDVQGTITGLIDKYNNLVEEYSYDACLSRCSREGRRRNPTNWTYDSVPQPQLLYRGYTMHEMLDEFGLINMNGRCYDPVVGRFLSPDIIVQNPNNTQCYNRYSYAINNPLKYSDPSGWVSIGNSNWAVQMAEMNRALWMNSYTRYCGMKDMFNQMVMAQFIAENGRPEESRGGGGGNSINNVRMFLDVPIMTRIGTFTLRNLLSIGLDKAGHFFSSEKDAYWYMWKRTLIYSVENSAFITQKGVLVLPCYNNEENRGTNCDPQEDKNCKFPFYYKAGWEKNNYYVYPPQNVFSEKLDVIGFIHTHYAFGENEWGGFSPGDWETGRDYFRGLPYFVFGGYNDRSDSKTFDGFYYRNGKGPYSFGEEHFNMLHLFNGLSIINLINKYY